MVYLTNPILSKASFIPERPCEADNCHGAISVEFEGGILSCGGGNSLLCHHYAWGATAWTTRPPMQRSHFPGSAVVLGGTKVWVSGGSTKTDLFQNGTWTDGPDLQESCFLHSFVALSEEEVCVTKFHKIASYRDKQDCFITLCRFTWAQELLTVVEGVKFIHLPQTVGVSAVNY